MRVNTATISTNYELSGPKNAPVVMLSHALGCNLHMWDPQMTALEVCFRIAAALEEGIVTPRSSFVLAPTIQVADRKIRESHSRGTERMSVKQILEQSSNIGTITIAQRLGAGQLAYWIDKFGFGKETGVDFPGESPGFALPLDQWSGSTIGTVPIGHGIAVTPIQMARAYSAIANGGVLVHPRLVERVGGQEIPLKAKQRVVSRRGLGSDARDAQGRRA